MSQNEELNFKLTLKYSLYGENSVYLKNHN